ncbi:MAG TPA: ECF-type sigma factor [Gemmataceae bacterium]|nr:ECF-type sigma factor [Gemmataceae bacterium]
MSSAGSVTHWLRQLQAGNHAAAQPLWERYFHQMVQLARQKLRCIRRGVADEEDVALSAFDSFCRGAEASRFPQLADSDSLWPLLVIITARKAIDLIQAERRQKRGGGAVPEELALDALLGTEPTPEFAAQIAEDYRRLLERLPDAGLRSLAQWKLEGYTNDEIALKLGCVRRSVERKLQLIRTLWQDEGEA